MSPERSASDALLGDVVAFTALPAVWLGQPPIEIAKALAEALDRTLLPDAVAVVLHTAHGTVDARAGRADLLDADVLSLQAGGSVGPATFHAPVGPLGRWGAILLRAPHAAQERLLLARLAANLAGTAMREAALVHEAANAREQLTRMEKLSALGQLVSGVAHELRTPLTYANNSVYLAQSRIGRATSLAPEERAGIDAMLSEVLGAHERIATTVSTLRHLSTPRPPAKRILALSEVVAEATRLFALTHVGQVAIARRLDAQGSVLADAVEVQQVVLNLLQNAAEAASGVARIVVSTQDGPEGVLLAVEDNGPGVPEEVRGRLFDPFFTTKAAGMGLGLSIVRRIAEAHGAAIRVGNAPGGGARFELAFPRVPQAVAPSPTPVDPLDTPDALGSPGSRRAPTVR